MRVCRTLTDLVAEIEEGGSVSFGQARSRHASPTSSEADSFTLGALRRFRKVTQTELARRLGRAQSAVSIMESSQDHLMSTVRSVVENLGGSVEVIAAFGDERIRLAVPVRSIRSSGQG